jgi:hypothetical protein
MNDALRRALTTPPKPRTNPRPAATKAEIAAQKRLDKTIIKRMTRR